MEFLGGLVPLVKTLGSPKLLPNTSVGGVDVTSVPIGSTGPISGPVGGALAVPMTVVGGFNKAYMPLADILPDECPGGITGDPHVVTIDGLRYSFQGVGEFWALRSDDGSVEVQVRTLGYGASTTASTTRGVATVIDGHSLIVDVDAADPITVDGVAVTSGYALGTDRGGAILVVDDGVAAYWPDGFTTLTIEHLDRPALSVHMTLHELLHGKVGGLLGNADGDPENDLVLPDGTHIAESFGDIYPTYRDAWRVAAADMLFEGPTVFRAGFPSRDPVVTADDRTAARRTCVEAGVVVGGLLEDCVFDVVVGGDDTFAEIHADNQRERMSLYTEGCELDLDGEAIMEGSGPRRLWQTDIQDLGSEPAWTFEYEDGIDSARVSEVVALRNRQALVIDTVNGVHVVDSDGTIRTTIGLSPLDATTPLIVGESVFIATEEGLAAVNLDGSICWHLLTHTDEDIATLGYGDGMVVATTSSDGGGVSVALAIDPARGGVVWQRPLQANVRQFGARVPAAIADGLVIVESASGGVEALELDSGDPVWIYESERPSDSLRGISATDSLVLVAGRSTGLTALDLETGQFVWNVSTAGTGVSQALAVSGNIALLTGESGMRAVNVADGSEVWYRDDLKLGGADTRQRPLVSNESVITYAAGRQVVKLALSTGEELERLDASTGSNSVDANRTFVGWPAGLGDTLLTVDRSGVLVAYR